MCESKSLVNERHFPYSTLPCLHSLMHIFNLSVIIRVFFVIGFYNWCYFGSELATATHGVYTTI